jgi:hypothetical protein
VVEGVERITITTSVMSEGIERDWDDRISKAAQYEISKGGVVVLVLFWCCLVRLVRPIGPNLDVVDLGKGFYDKSASIRVTKGHVS